MIYGWQRRAIPGGSAFVILTAAVFVWSFGNGLELSSLPLSQKIFWANTEYIGMVTLPIAWFVFALQYTGRIKRLTFKMAALLAIIPILTVVLVWTNESHGLIRNNVWLDSSGAVPVVMKTYGAWFWICVIYSYVLITMASSLTIHLLIKPNRFYRNQSIVLLIGVAAPWVANLLYILKVSPVSRLDLTPPAFAITGIALAWGCFRFHLLDILPVAYDTVVEEMSDGVIVLDRWQRILDLNPAAQKIIGKQAADPLDEALIEQVKISDGAGSSQREVVFGERVYDVKITAIKGQHGELDGKLIVLRDITEHKQMEKRLAQSEKIAALGRFLSGIAHELNNPLTAIIGFTELLLIRGAIAPTVRNQLEIINQEAERSKNIVHNLLAFAGQAALKFSEEDINELLDRTLQLREAERLAAGINIRRERSEMPKICIDYYQMQKAFLNILMNAEQALQNREEKILTVSTRFKESDTVPVIEVVFADTGSGIAEEDLSKIFDPFFTTKPVGKGMGLGLSISYGIITEHKGAIRVESEQGKWTKVTVAIPMRTDVCAEPNAKRFLEHPEHFQPNNDRLM